MTEPRLKVALLCDDDYGGYQSAIRDHIEALLGQSRHAVVAINPRGLSRGVGLSLDSFDALIVHFSLWIIWPDYLPEWARTRVRRFSGPKLMFIQDEYRMVDREVAAIADMGIHVLYSAAEPHMWPLLYGHSSLSNLSIRHTLTGYVPAYLESLATPSMAERRLHIGYRARGQKVWLGALAREKREIADGVAEKAAAEGLLIDISCRTEDTIFGPAWIPFLTRCKATLGTESGASVVDFDGSLPDRVAAYMLAHPGAGDKEIARDLLAPLEGVVTVRAIGPRVFEAAATRTALVMFPGDYNGVVRPWEHYLPLAKDFSNFSEIAGHLRDDTALTAMTERTHADLVHSGRYSYREFVAGIDRDLDAEMRRLGRRPGGVKVDTARAWRRRVSLARRLDFSLQRLEAGIRRVMRFACLVSVFICRPRAWQAFVRLYRGGGAIRLLTDLTRLTLLFRGYLGPVGVDGERDGASIILLGRKDVATGQSWETYVAALEKGEILEILWRTELEPGSRPFLMDDGDYRFESIADGLADGTIAALLRHCGR